MNAKLNALHSWFRNLGLILACDAPFLHSPSAMWTLLRQGYVDDLIDTPGNRPTTSPPVLASCFASRFLRVRLGIPSREGGRLTLSRSQHLFQQTSQSLVLFLQRTSLRSCLENVRLWIGSRVRRQRGECAVPTLCHSNEGLRKR